MRPLNNGVIFEIKEDKNKDVFQRDNRTPIVKVVAQYVSEGITDIEPGDTIAVRFAMCLPVTETQGYINYRDILWVD